MFLHFSLYSLQSEDSRSSVSITVEAWVSMLDLISSNSAVNPSTPATIYATPLSIVLLRSELMLCRLSLAVVIDSLTSELTFSILLLVNPSTPATIYATPLSTVLLRSELMLFRLSLAAVIDSLTTVLTFSILLLVNPSTPATIYATPLSTVLLRSELMLCRLSLAAVIDSLTSELTFSILLLAVFIEFSVSALIWSIVWLTVATCDPMSDLKRLIASFI